MDYGHNGLLATIKYLTDLELPFAGTGRNLAEASKPAFLRLQMAESHCLE
jgi:poly-gamma-glutamate synthesis protein (capsule biosynthesis protein)